MTAWPGISNRMVVGDSGNLFLDTLPSGQPAPYGEHFFYVDLGNTYHARSWLETDLIVLEGGVIWDNFLSAWDSMDAAIPWQPVGDLDGAYLDKRISLKFNSLPTAQVYGFALSSDLKDFRGSINATESHSASTFTTARFGNGLSVTDLTRVSWQSLSIPSSFGMKYNYHVSGSLTDSVVFFTLKNNSTGKWIEVGYQHDTPRFYALDSNGDEIELPGAITDDDFIMIGINQTATSRSLFYHSTWGQAHGFLEKEIAALGTFDRLYLYPL